MEEINQLLTLLFTDQEVMEIEKVIEKVKGKDKNAISELGQVLGTVPKRPLYYIDANIRLGFPDDWHRDIVRYSGDYIDQLVKFTLEDEKYFSKWFKNPLGPNIEKLRKFIDKELYEMLKKFNVIYAASKHEFNHQEDISLFETNEVVYIIYITKKLSEKILLLSETARDYNSHGETFYRYNPVDD